MSDNISENGVNISINNSDGGQSGNQSFLDRIFDLGIKLIIPIILVFALFSVIIFFGVVLPLLESVGGLVLPIVDIAFPGVPLSPAIGGLGVLFGWLTGRD